MIELAVTLYVLGAIGTFIALYSMVETHRSEIEASQNTIVGRSIILATIWPGLVLLFLIMALLPDRGEGLQHWIMYGKA